MRQPYSATGAALKFASANDYINIVDLSHQSQPID